MAAMPELVRACGKAAVMPGTGKGEGKGEGKGVAWIKILQDARVKQ